MDPSTFASGTLQFPIVRDSARPSRQTPRTSLPKMWIGFALAAICLAAFVYGVSQIDTAAIGIANIASFAGSIYWLYCIYRIHKVLAEATLGAYPISARRAVGFQLIPIYSLIWSFKWPKEISKFLKQQPGNHEIRHGLVGLALVLAALLLTIPTGLHLALFFAVGAYLERHIAGAIPWAVSVPHVRKERVNLAISTGLGAGYGLLLSTAVLELMKSHRGEFFHASLTIALASIAAVKFVEPLAERCRHWLGIPHEHFATGAGSPRRIRAGLFLLLVGTSASHGLLHDHIHGLLSPTLVHDALSESGITLIGALLFAGGITYSWVSTSRRSALGSTLICASSGAIIGLVVVFVVWAYASAAYLSPTRFPSVRDIADALSGSVPFTAAIFKLSRLATRGALFGLLGGLAIRQKAVPRLLALYAVLIASALVLGIIRQGGLHRELLTSFGFALGWCAGLLVYPHPEAVLTGTPVGPHHLPKAASAAA